MVLHQLQGRNTGGYTTFGGVWEKGEVKSPSFILNDEHGKEIPVQSKVMAWWPDGSVKWSAHTADSEHMGSSAELLPAVFPSGEQESAVDALKIEKQDDGYGVDTGEISLFIPAGRSLPSDHLARELCLGKLVQAESIYPVFCMEHRHERHGRGQEAAILCREVGEYRGEVCSVELEEAGPYQAVFCFRGNHVTGESVSMPFVIRMYLWSRSREIRFVHTFFYDGKEDRDFPKGMGIRFALPVSGAGYDRHIQYDTEGRVFHENAVILASNHPRLPLEVLERQQAGERHNYEGDKEVEQAVSELPVWQRYSICQDSGYHYAIKKRTHGDCCELVCGQGKRSSGVMAVSGSQSGMMLGIRDFWQKYPSGMEADGLCQSLCRCTLWFYSPEAEAYDFRHYDKKSYPRTCYEGFDYVGASAYGIGVTSECRILCSRTVPENGEIKAFGNRLNKPPVYVASPEYYHAKRAFGYWSLKQEGTETERWLEDQLDRAFQFYKEEVEARDWYGLFDYGDVMHTYDSVRHCWKYDMGGFAWQNTELVPTYWLGLYFMRTGREDVFTMLEAMSRHCSEVDVYHFGTYKGMGSRHNVRHWGCSCKEPRIAMAGHHRFLYYLTGDFRLGDIFDEVRDSDYTMDDLAHRRKADSDNAGSGESMETGVRSGPDWSSFVSNWMTRYERTLDPVYRDRILQGTGDIAKTPYGFASGPDYFYDVEKAQLIYRGEIENTPNQHLQICMGGPQVWLETADMLGDDRLKQMISDLGSFYFISREEKIRRTHGAITSRPFSWPMFATGIAGYSAMDNRDENLAGLTWAILLGDLISHNGMKGYEPVSYGVDGEGRACMEIPWNTTNCTSQWCLNVMMCLEFIREYLPSHPAEVKQLLDGYTMEPA